MSDDFAAVKSDLWPRSNGTVDWAVVAGLVSRTASGNAPSIAEAYDAIDAKLHEWFGAAYEEVRVVRLLLDS